MRGPLHPPVLLLALLWMPATQVFADVSVTTLDRDEPVRGISLTADGNEIAVHSARGPVVRLPAARVIEIATVPEPPAPPARAHPFELELTGGSRLRGVVRAGPGDRVKLSSPLFSESGGSLDLDLEQLRAVRRADGTRLPGSSRLVRLAGKDAAYRLTGARVEGFVARFSGTGVEISRGRLRAVTIPYDELAAILLDNEPAAVAPGLRAAARLVDGSVLVLSNGFKVSGGVVSGQTPTGLALRIAREYVVSIGFEGADFVHLSDLDPVETRRTPFFPLPEGPAAGAMLDFVCPVQRDRSPDGRPITLAKRRYFKGLGVRPTTELTWVLGGTYREFRALCGIDDEVLGPGYGHGAGRGSVVFEVRVDGKTVFSSEPVTGGRDPVRVQVPLEGAQRLTLAVTLVPASKMPRGVPDSPELDNAVWARPLLIR